MLQHVGVRVRVRVRLRVRVLKHVGVVQQHAYGQG